MKTFKKSLTKLQMELFEKAKEWAEVSEPVKQLLDSPLYKDIPFLKYLKPYKFKKEFIRQIFTSVVFSTPAQFEEMIKSHNNELPIIWTLCARAAYAAFSRGDMKSVQTIFEYLTGETAVSREIEDNLTIKRAVLLIPSPEHYDEQKVIKEQKQLQAGGIEEIESALNKAIQNDKKN